MATTDNLLPYPGLGDDPNIPADMQALAVALRGAPVLNSTGSSGALGSTPILPGGLIAYVGLTVINYNTADPAEVRMYRCIDTSPVRWLDRDWNTPWGVPASGVVCQAVTQTGVGASPTDVTGMTVTFTALANRRYKITAFLRMIQRTSTGNIVLILTDGAGTQITGLGATGVVANAEWSPTVVIHETYSAGSITRKLRMQTSAGTVDSASAATSPALLIVEDVGPSGQPT